MAKYFTRTVLFVGNESWWSVTIFKTRNCLMKLKLFVFETFSMDASFWRNRWSVRWRYMAFSSPELSDPFSWSRFGMSLRFRFKTLLGNSLKEFNANVSHIFRWKKQKRLRKYVHFFQVVQNVCISVEGNFQIFLAKTNAVFFSAAPVHINGYYIFLILKAEMSLWFLFFQRWQYFKQLTLFSLLCSLLASFLVKFSMPHCKRSR